MNPVAMTLLPQLKDDRKDEVIEKLFSRQENVLDQNDRHYEIRISKVTGRDVYKRQGKSFVYNMGCIRVTPVIVLGNR